jgi:LPXTG-site transpeptidase (sortase) family protein
MTTGLHIDASKERHVLRWIFATIFVVLLGVSAWYGYRWYVDGEQPPIIPLPASALADTSLDEKPVTDEQVSAHTVPANQPRYISIPTLGINKSRVMAVGLTKNNLLDTPKNINDTAWYDKSATPGSGSGAVVIDGHNGGVTKDGIFAGLHKLAIGDEIIIERGDGKVLRYGVAENETMTIAQANNEGMKKMMLSAEPGTEGLSLITCAGKWIPRDKIFDKRVMLRAVAID